MTGTLLPLVTGTVLALAAVALALYVWTWVRYVGFPEGAERAQRRQRQPCSGCPALA
jgi:hypothetical protein